MRRAGPSGASSTKSLQASTCLQVLAVDELGQVQLHPRSSRRTEYIPLPDSLRTNQVEPGRTTDTRPRRRMRSALAAGLLSGQISPLSFIMATDCHMSFDTNKDCLVRTACNIPLRWATFKSFLRSWITGDEVAQPTPLTYQSKVSLALKGVASVRTTIPEPIARLIGAGTGSTLEWSVVPGSRTASIVVVANPGSAKRSKRD